MDTFWMFLEIEALWIVAWVYHRDVIDFWYSHGLIVRLVAGYAGLFCFTHLLFITFVVMTYVWARASGHPPLLGESPPGPWVGPR